MPWSTPTLREVRSLIRDSIRGSLPGADALIPNSNLRIMSDAQGGACHLSLQYIDWLALQLIPDTAETEWLDRHGDIWLTNADGTTGRKVATLAEGTASLTGDVGTVVPVSTRMTGPAQIEYETLEQVYLGSLPSDVSIRALDPGAIGNQEQGAVLTIIDPVVGLDGAATVNTLTGGVDEENDNYLRARLLKRIRQPPMGGDANDYELWALAVPGVTRAWCAPLEMGIGTVSVRFMMDELRAENDGFPLPEDIDTVQAYLDSQRPVAVKDFFVVSPIPEPIDFTIKDLEIDDPSTRAAIIVSVKDMLQQRAAPAYVVDGFIRPAQEIYAAWVSDAILNTAGVYSFTLLMDDHPMPNSGCLAVLGTVIYSPS
jgi:uncharacterized phage protein gp47/JayE